MSNSTCFEEFNNPRFIAVVSIRAVAGAISFICCLGVIGLIVLFRKHHFFTQRLILYLTLATIGYSVVSFINIGYNAYTSDALQGYCAFAGFVEQVTSWWVPLAIACIVVDLFFKVIFNKPTDKLEIPYVLITFVSPLLISWIPFIHSAYGQAGAWCWIRDTNYDDCNDFKFGTGLRFALYWIPILLLMIVLVIMLVMTIIFIRKQQKQWTGKYDPEIEQMRKQMQKEVRPLIAYPLIFLVLNFFPFINRIANIISSDPVFVLWLFAAVSLPLGGLIITIAFVVDPETRSKITVQQLLGAIRNYSTNAGEIEEYPIGGQRNNKEKEIEKSSYIPAQENFNSN